MDHSPVATHSVARSITRSLPLIMALSLAVIPAHAASSFRGFTVDDTPQDIEAIAAKQNLTVKWTDVSEDFTFMENVGGKTAAIHQGEEECASISFSKPGKIVKMAFRECFFNAEGMGLRQITQQFVDKFGGSAEFEFKSPFWKCPGADMQFKGQTTEGERFVIDVQASVTTFKCGAVVTIAPGKRAQF